MREGEGDGVVIRLDMFVNCDVMKNIRSRIRSRPPSPWWWEGVSAAAEGDDEAEDAVWSLWEPHGGSFRLIQTLC